MRCPGNVDSILSEDVLAIEGFMGVTYNAALLYNEFKSLRCIYTSHRVQKRANKLEMSLRKVDETITENKEILLEVRAINLIMFVTWHRYT